MLSCWTPWLLWIRKCASDSHRLTRKTSQMMCFRWVGITMGGCGCDAGAVCWRNVACCWVGGVVADGAPKDDVSLCLGKDHPPAV